MRNVVVPGVVMAFFMLAGCVSPQASSINNNDELDLYLSTLDDKHFVWCELDLEQCRKDFETWKLTPRGQTILREYEKEDTGQTYSTHDVPNVFRTRFVNGSQLVEEGEETFDVFEQESLPLDSHKYMRPERIPSSSRQDGPDAHSH